MVKVNFLTCLYTELAKSYFLLDRSWPRKIHHGSARFANKNLEHTPSANAVSASHDF